MEKIFEKYETLICMLLIIIYIVLNSFCMQNFGIADYRTVIVNTVISMVLIILFPMMKELLKILHP